MIDFIIYELMVLKNMSTEEMLVLSVVVSICNLLSFTIGWYAHKDAIK